MAQLNITLDTELLHELFTKDSQDQTFSKLLGTILNQVLVAQSTEQLGAEPYERSEDRTAYRNGFRERDLTTHINNYLTGTTSPKWRILNNPVQTLSAQRTSLGFSND